MSNKYLLSLALAKKWTCSFRNCQQEATHIQVKKKLKPDISFSGRCAKHKTPECITLEEIRKIVNE